jgi:hypothetical protein
MPSMGSVGDAYDNAMAESFFATLESELLSRRRFRSQAEATMAVFEWAEGWYNPSQETLCLGLSISGQLRAISSASSYGVRAASASPACRRETGLRCKIEEVSEDSELQSTKTENCPRNRGRSRLSSQHSLCHMRDGGDKS